MGMPRFVQEKFYTLINGALCNLDVRTQLFCVWCLDAAFALGKMAAISSSERAPSGNLLLAFESFVHEQTKHLNDNLFSEVIAMAIDGGYFLRQHQSGKDCSPSFRIYCAVSYIFKCRNIQKTTPINLDEEISLKYFNGKLELHTERDESGVMVSRYIPVFSNTTKSGKPLITRSKRVAEKWFEKQNFRSFQAVSIANEKRQNRKLLQEQLKRANFDMKKKYSVTKFYYIRKVDTGRNRFPDFVAVFSDTSKRGNKLLTSSSFLALMIESRERAHASSMLESARELALNEFLISEQTRVYASRTFPPKLRSFIFNRDQYTCQLCLRDKDALIQFGHHLQVDHIVAVEDGGETTLRNGQTVCSECNIGKHYAKRLISAY